MLIMKKLWLNALHAEDTVQKVYIANEGNGFLLVFIQILHEFDLFLFHWIWISYLWTQMIVDTSTAEEKSKRFHFMSGMELNISNQKHINFHLASVPLIGRDVASPSFWTICPKCTPDHQRSLHSLMQVFSWAPPVAKRPNMKSVQGLRVRSFCELFSSLLEWRN